MDSQEAEKKIAELNIEINDLLRNSEGGITREIQEEAMKIQQEALKIKVELKKAYDYVQNIKLAIIENGNTEDLESKKKTLEEAYDHVQNIELERIELLCLLTANF